MSDIKKAVILLEDGKSFEGRSIGYSGTTSGELCFNTGMTGYQEIFSDPSYAGQLMVMSHVHIGNYGARDVEMESDRIQIKGLIVRDFSEKQFRQQSTSTLQEHLEEYKVVGITGIDTRALVRHVCMHGAINAVISSEVTDIEELKKVLSDTPDMKGLELSSHVSTTTSYEVKATEEKFKVAALDLGIKRSIIQCMVDRGCSVKVYPAKTPYAEMSAYAPDGIFISNGPGDPAVMGYAVDTIKDVLEAQVPLFGICLGHQLLARAVGADTYKLHHGHRGINHPVLNLQTGLAEITSQNHGFGVSAEAAERCADCIEVTHVNLNDGTIEGLRVKGHKAFSVQYHPEASPGPHDARYLFDRFVESMSHHEVSA